jgi:hypothetical protein
MKLIQPVRVGQDEGHRAAKRRLLLVDPYPRNNPYHLTASERRAVWFPKLSLPTIAAYTPESWDVDLVDEAVEDIDFDDPCEMVGLSIMTCYAPRAYEIAAEFRKRGKTIVMGGVHRRIARKRRCSIAMRSCAGKPRISGPNWWRTTRRAA